MSDSSISSQNNEQILNDIQNLQKMEQNLFSNLETNRNLTTDQQQKIIEKMNEISNMRISLYQTLSGMNIFFKNALSSSVGTLQEQASAIDIVENELNQSKRRLEALQAEKNNKIRLVEINDYYSDKYAEHTQLMKIIIYTLVPIICFAILNNKGLLPNQIYYGLLIIVAFIGAYYFWIRYASIVMRDNMNYQEYNWGFNPSDLPSGASTSGDDPWASTSMSGTCIGEYCCSDGLSWDSSLGQCVVSTVDTTTTTSGTTESFLTEPMVNNVLTKTQPGKYKTDYNLAAIQAPMSKSFINGSKK